MKVKPVLGDWPIPNIETIRSLEQRSFAELTIPGRVGSLYHDLNAAPARIAISGSLFGDEVRDDFLNKVRGKFHDGAALTFVADIVTATTVQYVIIETLRFEENGNRPDQTDFYLVLRESPPPPPPPDPLGGLDSGLLDEAKGFLGSVTGALDAVSALSTVPDLKDPTPPLKGAVDGVKGALGGLTGVVPKITDLFGSGG
jgi:hypothetical protein